MVLEADYLDSYELFIRIKNNPVAPVWKSLKNKISQILLRLLVVASARFNFDTQKVARTQKKILTCEVLGCTVAYWIAFSTRCSNHCQYASGI